MYTRSRVSHFLKVALSENGYTSIEDLVDVPASDLALGTDTRAQLASSPY